MQYRPYGATGKQVSVIGAGGMRFETPSNDEELQRCADILVHAHELGVNYFDTAPMYCGDRSEEIVAAAIRRMPAGSYYVSSKCMAATGDDFRRGLERSLERLGLECIHFFHIWCLLTLDAWDRRKSGGAVAAALAAREEGLIEHLVFSSHLSGEETAQVIREGIFEGVTLGYNVLNFRYREEGIRAASEAGIGVVTMNPLAGGIIPQQTERLAFIRRPADRNIVESALRFNISQSAISCALVGFNKISEVDMAVGAVAPFTPYTPAEIEEVKIQIGNQFEGLCTGCGYCLPCPVDMPIPKYMDVFNQRILGRDDEEMSGRMKYHWGLDAEGAAACTACGQCEEKCTQHLPIIERLKAITALGDVSA